MGFSIRYSHGFSPTLFEYSFGMDFDIQAIRNELIAHRMQDTLHVTAFGAEYDFLISKRYFDNRNEKGVCRTVDLNQIVNMLKEFKAHNTTYMVA